MGRKNTIKLYNPYTKKYVDHNLDLNSSVYHYRIQHETPFSDRCVEWDVDVLESGDMMYVPCGNNMCPNIYIVTKLYLDRSVKLPHGIYTIPVEQFTYKLSPFTGRYIHDYIL